MAGVILIHGARELTPHEGYGRYTTVVRRHRTETVLVTHSNRSTSPSDSPEYDRGAREMHEARPAGQGRLRAAVPSPTRSGRHRPRVVRLVGSGAVDRQHGAVEDHVRLLPHGRHGLFQRGRPSGQEVDGLAYVPVDRRDADAEACCEAGVGVSAWRRKKRRGTGAYSRHGLQLRRSGLRHVMITRRPILTQFRSSSRTP